ncbi:amine dehydrogenase large subunit [Alteromonas sp. 14N.309.X.WAT.G.H12]|uniref:amine dehydrogenase large subunit n=1 Tax=Alteromonas sp. 14N.309.X.WAT.G.H12 TaxID=3120824 RepID=UPI002FD09F77
MKLRKLITVCSAVSSIAFANSAVAELEIEKVGLIKTLPDTPHLIVSEYGRSHVLDPETFSHQGTISEATQKVLSLDGKTLYTTRTYYDKGREGAKHDNVRFWDMETLTPTVEIPIVDKLAMTGMQIPFMQGSAKQKWLFLQNATPATSVTVFDVAGKKQAAEVPLPGCWGIYPIMNDEDRFVSLCGDGRLSAITLKESGEYGSTVRSDIIFDVDSDPLFVFAEREGDTLFFVSFNGNFYTIDISGERPLLKSKKAIVPEGTPGNYKPSGYQLMSKIPGTSYLYILMQEEAWDGSHIEPATEAWVYDYKTNKIVSRSTISDGISVQYYSGDGKYLFLGTKKHGLVRYFVDPNAAYTLRRDKFMKMERPSAFTL